MVLVHELKDSSFWSKAFKSQNEVRYCLVSVGSEWKLKIIFCCIGCLLLIFHLCQGSLSPVSSCCSATYSNAVDR